MSVKSLRNTGKVSIYFRIDGKQSLAEFPNGIMEFAAIDVSQTRVYMYVIPRLDLQ